jgi:hypothetical protein
VRVQRLETAAGPVAVAGRTISLVARTSVCTSGTEPARLVGVRSRPDHVEVLGADGRRDVLKVRDYQTIATAAIAAVAAACVLASRLARNSGAGGRR